MALNPTTVKANLSIGAPPLKLKAENKDLYDYLLVLVKSLNEWISTTANTINTRANVGLAADLPPNPPSLSSRLYYAYDTKVLYLDDGRGTWSSVQLV